MIFDIVGYPASALGCGEWLHSAAHAGHAERSVGSSVPVQAEQGLEVKFSFMRGTQRTCSVS